LIIITGQLNAQDTEALYEGPRIKIDFCESTMSLKSPVELVKSVEPVPSASADKIQEIIKHSYLDELSLMIYAKCVLYKPEFEGDKKSILPAMDIDLTKMGGTDIHYKDVPIDSESIEAIKQEGWMEIDGRAYDFLNVIYTKDNRLWQVFVAHEQHDLFGYTLADNLINSIRFSETK